MNPEATIPVSATRNSTSATFSKATASALRLVRSAKKIVYVHTKNSKADIASVSSATVFERDELPSV